MADKITSADKTTSDALKKLAFFAGLPATLLWHLAHAAERRSMAKDEILFREGETRNLLAVILSGALAIEQHRDGKAVPIAALGAGEVLGEGILLEDGAHRTLGRATQETELLFFRKTPLLKLLKDHPALYAALVGRAAKMMNDRIKGANATLIGAKADSALVRAEMRKWLDGFSSLGKAVGYETAIEIAREALDAGKDVAELAKERQLVK
jgi:aspartate ammonia-lyase